MSKQDNSVLIIIGILVILAIGAWIELQEIYFAQVMFWITLILIPIGLVIAIVSFILGIKGRGEDENYMHWIIFAVSIILVIFFITQINNFYNNGYSNKAIQEELQLKEELGQYELAIGLLSSPEDQITNLAMESTISSICNTNPGFTCEQIKNIWAWKEKSDKVAKFIGLTET